MLASATSANRRISQPKLKAACDQCTASKVKCPGGGPRCKRCADSSQPCQYSLARRYGKPPGSKNRKTLETLRYTKERHWENGGSRGGDCSVPQNNDRRDDDDRVVETESKR